MEWILLRSKRDQCFYDGMFVREDEYYLVKKPIFVVWKASDNYENTIIIKFDSIVATIRQKNLPEREGEVSCHHCGSFSSRYMAFLWYTSGDNIFKRCSQSQGNDVQI